MRVREGIRERMREGRAKGQVGRKAERGSECMLYKSSSREGS